MTSRDQKGSSTRRDQCIVNGGKAPKASSSSSRPWQLTKDPRIVRVARSFGGKDRHSKVCTVRGLRDRRVRLSVQTAIQLYDLQDRLGLSQPSKVVDWLLEAAQQDIDKLPPLQMPIENLVQFAQPMLVPHEMTTPSFGGGHPFALASVKTMQNSDTENGAGHDQAADHQPELLRTGTRSSYNIWSPNHGQLMKDKGKLTLGKETNWLKIQENQEGSSNVVNQLGYHMRPSQTTLATSFMNNVHVPYASYYHWEPPSSTYGVGLPSQQTEDHHNSSTTMPSNSGSQLLFYPSGMLPSMLPSYVSSASVDQLDSKHMINHVQMLNPNSQNLLPSAPTATSHVYSICTPSMIPFQVSIAPRQQQQLPANDHGTRAVVDQSQRSDNHVSPMALAPGSSFRENPKPDAGSNPPSFL